MNDVFYVKMGEEELIKVINELETAIRAAIRKLDSGGLTHREREAIHILQERLEGSDGD